MRQYAAPTVTVIGNLVITEDVMVQRIGDYNIVTVYYKLPRIGVELWVEFVTELDAPNKIIWRYLLDEALSAYENIPLKLQHRTAKTK